MWVCVQERERQRERDVYLVKVNKHIGDPVQVVNLFFYWAFGINNYFIKTRLNISTTVQICITLAWEDNEPFWWASIFISHIKYLQVRLFPHHQMLHLGFLKWSYTTIIYCFSWATTNLIHCYFTFNDSMPLSRFIPFLSTKFWIN